MNSVSKLGPPSKASTVFSCVRCSQRKVKCDKQQPSCAVCLRRNVECDYRAPPPARRKKHKAQDDNLADLVKHYERLLEQNGINGTDRVSQPEATQTEAPSTIEDSKHDSHSIDIHSNESVSDNRQFVSSQLVTNQGRSRYLENHLWTRVTEELSSPHDALDDVSEDESDTYLSPSTNAEFILGVTPSSITLKDSHPSPDNILRIWKIFLSNVNPLIKIIHWPTLDISIHKAAENIDRAPKNLEALMFAIYSVTILSIQAQECEEYFGETKATLLARYQGATRLALSRAKFLSSSDLVVLQSFILYLLSMRDEYDPRTLWILSSVATRMAEGMGVHRDGTILGLPPFETEMRRRIWWHLMMSNGRAAELSGSSKSGTLSADSKSPQPPSNINDDQIWPGIRELPLPKEEISEMVFCMLRIEMASFWMKGAAHQKIHSAPDRNIWENYETVKTINEVDATTDELQEILESKYVRFCDPTDSLQLMTSLVARGGLAMPRLMSHHPRRYQKDEHVPESELQLVWSLSMKLLAIDSMCYTDKKLNRYIWNSSFFFQWQALIYVLDRMRSNPLLPEANEGWIQVHETYEHHPEYVSNTKKALHIAVGTLCVKAYDAREKALVDMGRSTSMRVPEYIIRLRQQREIAKSKQKEREARHQFRQTDLNANPPAQQDHPPMPHQIQHDQHYSLPALDMTSDDFNFNDLGFQPVNTSYQMDFMLAQDPPLDDNAMDWTQWDYFVQEL